MRIRYGIGATGTRLAHTTSAPMRQMSCGHPEGSTSGIGRIRRPATTRRRPGSNKEAAEQDNMECSSNRLSKVAARGSSRRTSSHQYSHQVSIKGQQYSHQCSIKGQQSATVDPQQQGKPPCNRSRRLLLVRRGRTTPQHFFGIFANFLLAVLMIPRSSSR